MSVVEMGFGASKGIDGDHLSRLLSAIANWIRGNIYIYIYACVYVCMSSMCECVPTCTRVYIFMCACVFICVYARVHMCMCMYIRK